MDGSLFFFGGAATDITGQDVFIHFKVLRACTLIISGNSERG